MAASKPTVQPTRKATDLRAQIPQRGGISPCAAVAFLVGAGPSPACRMRLRFSACFGTLPSTRQEGTGTLYSSSCACGLRPRAPSHSLSTKSLVAQKQSRSVAESATRGRPSPQRTTLLLSAGLSPACRDSPPRSCCVTSRLTARSTAHRSLRKVPTSSACGRCRN